MKHVLLVSSSKEGDLINYRDSDSRFMFNFGDGAAAALLERDLDENVILESAMIADGQFAADVSVPASGCRNFEGFRNMPMEDHFLRVLDVANMKERLDPITLGNFVSVIAKAADRSGFGRAHIDYLAPIFMKKSILLHLLDQFGACRGEHLRAGGVRPLPVRRLLYLPAGWGALRQAEGGGPGGAGLRRYRAIPGRPPAYNGGR